MEPFRASWRAVVGGISKTWAARGLPISPEHLYTVYPAALVLVAGVKLPWFSKSVARTTAINEVNADETPNERILC
jgi:hypothetical protein